ncbi:hypothetical protein [Streptomyces sp. NPDC002769]|uniref:hypothetical protein n=1 Tax=Streptomyces sp. NPDC002769 TaxID=3154542 RepID=UPI00332893BF
MSSSVRVTRPDRLELGEGIRWTGEEVVLVDHRPGRHHRAPAGPPPAQVTPRTTPVR